MSSPIPRPALSNTLLVVSPQRGRARASANGLLRFCTKKKAGGAGLLIASVLLVLAVVGPAVVPYDKDQVFDQVNPKYDATSLDPDALNPTNVMRLTSPSLDHWFGTDDKGRDLFTRIVLATRSALQVGIFASMIAVVLGGLIGLISGYFGGMIDLATQRFVDAMIAIPSIVFFLLLIQIAQPSLWLTIGALGLLRSFGASRVVRASVLAVRAEAYVDAAHVIGASSVRIMTRHVLPNVLSPIIVIFTISIGANILAASGLAFLNLGVPGPDWGAMLNSGRQFLDSSPGMSLFSGGALTLTILSFNLLGDAIRDVLDPRQRQR